jgi:hypothetical protein
VSRGQRNGSPRPLIIVFKTDMYVGIRLINIILHHSVNTFWAYLNRHFKNNSACTNKYLCMDVIMLVIIPCSDLACKVYCAYCYNLVKLFLLLFLNRIQERSNV